MCAVLLGSLTMPATGFAAAGAGEAGGSGGSGLTSGGAAPGPAPSGSSGPSTASGAAGSSSSPAIGSGNATVSAAANGITIQTRASAMLRKGLSFSGTAPQRLAGDTIEIERSGHQTNGAWTPTVSATVGPTGSFSAVWHTNHIGRFAIRAVVSAASVAQAAVADPTAPATASTPAVTVTVYRPSLTTQYGPGFYGHRTACGQKLTVGMIGVANRTLPCGTPVAIYYRGRTMVVPVIDRGPYANGADWDLTEATGRALGINGTAEIGAVSLPTR